MDSDISLNQIMKRAIDAYASFHSYQDSGFVEETSSMGAAKGECTKLYFKTLFKRPSFFRIEWSEESKSDWSRAIWSDGNNVFWKRNLDEIELVTDLPLRLGVAGTLSRGVADSVPVLLMSKSNYRCAIDPIGFISLGEVQLNGENCDHLHQSKILPMGPEETHLWVSRERFVIVQLMLSKVIDHARFDAWFERHGEQERVSDPVANEAEIDSRKRAMKMLGEAEIQKNPDMESWRLQGFANLGQPQTIHRQIHYSKILLDEEITDDSFTG